MTKSLELDDENTNILTKENQEACEEEITASECLESLNQSHGSK